MRHTWRLALVALALAGIAGCSADDGRRSALMRDRYPSYPEEIKKAIDNGTLVKGMTQEQVILAIGESPCVSTRTLKGKVYDTWVYRLDRNTMKYVVPEKCNQARRAIVFENGRLISWDTEE